MHGKDDRLLVVIGPFNEHLLIGQSVDTFAKIKQEMQAELAAQQIACVVPPVLPTEVYADASHPLAAGYERLSRQLLADPAFGTWFRSAPSPGR